MVTDKDLEKVECNLCGSRKSRIIFNGNPYKVVNCAICGLDYLNPRPQVKKIENFYQKNYFQSGLNSSGYSDYSILDNELVLEAQKRLKFIKRYVGKGTLLDVGCGYGHFLHQALKEGFDVMGVDISREAIKILKKRYGIPGFISNVKNGYLSKKHFNIITGWDVVEHFSDPKASLSILSSTQKSNDYLFLTTPNIDSLDARILGRYWYGFKRIPEHLYFFSAKTIELLMKKSGYEILDIKPWGFYRNIEYCVDQIARYNKTLYRFTDRLVNFLSLKKKTFFFPIINMIVVSRKR